MAILVKPPQLTSIDTDLGTSVATGLWKQARDLMNYVNASYPFGMVLMFDASWANTYGIGPPDPNFWQFMDGSAVTNVNSPLYGVHLPDMRGKFMRHAYTGEVIGNITGATPSFGGGTWSATVNLSHYHGGDTGFTLDQVPGDTESDDQNGGRDCTLYHDHGISVDLPSVSVMPVYREVQCYMRIL